MPLATPEPVPAARLLDRAQVRWDQLLSVRPELQPAVHLQSRMLTIMLELTSTLASGRLPRLSLPAKYVAAKLGRGVPVLAGEPIPLPLPALTPVLMRVATELADGGAGQAAQAIGQAVSSGTLTPLALLTSSLAREQQTILALAAHANVPGDLLWLAAEITVAPYAYLLQLSVFDRRADEPAIDTALAGWNQGYCPSCGSWPIAAEVARGHRVLRCGFCSAGWELDHYACVYCDEAGENFVTAAPDEERKDRRVEVCRACAGYLKTIDLNELSPFPLVAVTDLETMDLDVAAIGHHYMRPAIKTFLKR